MSQPKRVLVCGGRNFGHVTQWQWKKYHNKDQLSNDLQQRLHQHRFILDTLERIALELHEVEREPEDEYGNWLPYWVIISGMANGVDTVAIEWAVMNWCSLEEYPADWKQYGKAAGPIRNQRMLDEGKPDLVIAFPGGRGTADMVRKAKAAGIEVREIAYEQDQA